MGFLDKAKQMAEQAQSKLDEVQKQFNESQGSRPQTGPAVEYDKHGRPIPKQDTAPPHGDPVGEAAPASAPPPAAAAPTPDPAAPAPPPPSAPAAPPPGPSQGVEEDRNHPSSAPPKLSSGDPLAG